MGLGAATGIIAGKQLSPLVSIFPMSLGVGLIAYGATHFKKPEEGDHVLWNKGYAKHGEGRRVRPVEYFMDIEDLLFANNVEISKASVSSSCVYQGVSVSSFSIFECVLNVEAILDGKILELYAHKESANNDPFDDFAKQSYILGTIVEDNRLYLFDYGPAL